LVAGLVLTAGTEMRGVVMRGDPTAVPEEQ
jgi:hypothetical protein